MPNLSKVIIANSEVELLAKAAVKLAPIVHLHSKDPHRPSSVEWFLQRCSLVSGSKSYDVLSMPKRFNRPSEMTELVPLLDGDKLAQQSPAKEFGDSGVNRNISIFPNPGPNPTYYSDSQFSKYQMETFKGQPLNGNNECVAEAYAHITAKDGFYFISYYFFYPYNGGMGPSNWDSKPLDNESGYYAHVGDWETITAMIKINMNKISLIKVVYEAHGDREFISDGVSKDKCTYDDANHSFKDKTLDQIMPIHVYSCWHSHASRPAPGKYCTDTVLAGDYADNGPIWYTGSNLVFITNESPSWVRYNGRWGANIEYKNMIKERLVQGPQGPAFHKTWIEGDEVNIDLKYPPYLGFNDQEGYDNPQYYKTIQFADIDGDGKAEMIGRSSFGLFARKYEPSTGQWVWLPDIPELSDQNGFGLPQYYETIQCADIDGDHRAELIARGASGIVAWKYEPSTWKWIRLPDILDFSDKNGYDNPQYYKTIQFADIDGDGKAEMIGRSSFGLFVRKYEPSTGQWVWLPDIPELSDQNGFSLPQYYETIQCADIDGDHRAELIARGASGIVAWKYEPSTGKWIDLGFSLSFIDNTFLAYWDRPQYYETIQCADIDGDGKAELIGRDILGISINRWSKPIIM